MGWDALEGAAFLYYMSRGMTLDLVGDFMQEKCRVKKRSKEDLVAALDNAVAHSKAKGWNIRGTNHMIGTAIAMKKMKWEDFLARMEFDMSDTSLLMSNGLYDLIERNKKSYDPSTTGRPPNPEIQSAFRAGGTTAMAHSLSESYPSISAPAPLLGSDSGTGYGRGTGATRGPSGGYGPSPYLPVGETFPGSSTANKRPATAELEGEDPHQTERRTTTGGTATQAGNVAKKRTKAQKEDEKKETRVEEERRWERAYEAGQDKLEAQAGEREEAGAHEEPPRKRVTQAERKVAREQTDRERQLSANRIVAERLVTHEPYRDDYEEPQEEREPRVDRKLTKTQAADRERHARVERKAAEKQAEKERKVERQASVERKVADRVGAFQPYRDDRGR